MQKKWIILAILSVSILAIGTVGLIYFQQNKVSHFSGFMFDAFEFSGFAGCNQAAITSLTDAGKTGVYEQYQQIAEHEGQLIYIEFDGKFNGKGTSGIGVAPWDTNVDVIKLTAIKKIPYTTTLSCDALNPFNDIFAEPPSIEFEPTQNSEEQKSTSEPATH